MIPDKVRGRILTYLHNVDSEKCIEYPILDECGYGSIQYRVDGKKRHYRAHRIAYQVFNNCELLSSEILLHSCVNPACVNPLHLSKGTHTDNVADKVKKGRQAKGEGNGRYTHGYYSRFAPVKKPTPEFKSLCNRSLSLDTVKSIKGKIKEGDSSLSDLAKQFGVKYQTVLDINTGRSYKNVLLAQ